MHNSTFYQSMDQFDELDDPSQLLMKEITSALDDSFEGYQDLQSKYSSLHETYAKEIQNSKKVEKCLVKCLKFYSKLCKKYEAQQKVLSHLKESVKEKMNSLEESLRTQEKMKGLIEIYRSERTHYSEMSNQSLRRDKEILLDICCRLISESVKNNNIRNITNIILKKFKKDLDDEKLNLLKGKEFSVKNEGTTIKGHDLGSLEDVKPSDLQQLKLKNKIYETSDANLSIINDVVAKSETKDEEKLASGQPKENFVKYSACDEDFNNLKVLEEHNLFTKGIYVVSPRRGNDVLPPSDNDLGNMPLLESSDFNKSSFNGNTKFYHGRTDNDLEKAGFDPSPNVPGTITSGLNNELRSQGSCEPLSFGEAGGEVKLHSDNTFGDKNSSNETESSSFSFSQHCSLRLNGMSDGENQKCASGKENENENFCIMENKKSEISSYPKIESPNPSQSIIDDESDITKSKSRININRHALDKPRVYTRKPKKAVPQSFVTETLDIAKNRENSKTVSDALSEGRISNFSEDQRFEQTPFNVISNGGSIFDVPKEVGVGDKDPKFFLKDCIGKEREPMNANILEKLKKQRQEILPPLFLSGSIFDIPEARSESVGLSPKDLGILSEEGVLNGEKTRKPEATTDFLLAQTELTEGELLVIFKEMSHVRLLSPIREISSGSGSCILSSRNKNHLFCGDESSTGTGNDLEPVKRCSSSTTSLSEISSKNKKLKLDKSWPTKKEENGGLLDSIISAMSMQNEEFKAKPVREHIDPFLQKVNEKIHGEPNACRFAESARADSTREKAGINEESLKKVQKTLRGGKDKEILIEKEMLKQIKKFVSSSISSNEDADRSVKECVSVLTKKPEDVIARCIVTLVLENIDEDIEMFERPAPPLTRTQHRLIVLLSVLKKVEPAADKIPPIILSIITDKFFPDTFFWPDDCVETTTRFFAALCKMRNDPKTLWKFCLKAMTEMKQRCCLIVFTALKTWPDILYDASTPHNNILAVTVVNLFLHMPKADGLRNFNQKKKLMALKHLLINFYQFKVEDTMETYAQKVFDSVLNKVGGSGKALALLAKCKDWSWTSKNILPKLEQGLKDWVENKVEDLVGNDILSVIKRVSSIFAMNGEKAKDKVSEVISSLSEIIASRKLNHGLEQNVIEVLLQMKEFPEARTAIREWVPRDQISDHLRNQVINVSAENILREVKLNRTSEKKGLSKFKRQAKKSKGKKKIGKRGKKRKKMGVKGAS